MRIKIVNKSKVFDTRINPKAKWSAEAALLVSEVTETPQFSETDIRELIEGVTDRITLQFVWQWLKSNGAAENAPRIFFEKLGFRADRLNETELENLKSLLAKFVRPKLRELEDERVSLTGKITSLNNIIALAKKESPNKL